ncbi:hypothetical protein BJ170DRAFT_634669 [Xylariales sp. AK1849]|nr:hypothetical protein BJ170DRAFT_634669 [Xylariales sp. AK1849]
MLDFTLTIFMLFIGVFFVKKLLTPTRTPSNMPLIINRRGGRRALPSQRIPLAPAVAGHQDLNEKQPASPSSPTQEHFADASPGDVTAVKKLLMATGKLPIEVADLIMDQAEYWACSSTTVDYSNLPNKHLLIRGASNTEDQFLVRTEPMALTYWSPDDDQAWRQQSLPAELQAEHPPEKLQAFADEPMPTLEHPCRKIVFNIQSNDQGWGGDHRDRGLFRHSWTWFDAGLERFDAKAPSSGNDVEKGLEDSSNLSVSTLRPLWPPLTSDDSGIMRYHHSLHATPEHKIQCNKLAVRQTQHHHVEWKWTDDVDPESSRADELDAIGRGRATGSGVFIRNMKLGDVVTVWGRARFGGWQNHVEKVEVKVYWAV